MSKKEKTTEKVFYDLGVFTGKLSQAMSENWLAFLQGTHSVEKFNDQFTYKQRFAFWVLDTAERFAEWIGGNK